MKKSILPLLTLLCAASLQAQSRVENLREKIVPYFSIRSYAIFDSRNVKAGSGDMFYYIPMDYNRNLEGQDIYSNPSLKGYAMTTLAGLDVSGFQSGLFGVSGKLEADFYLLSGTTASMRLRQAYVDFGWKGLGYGENSFSFRFGQAWHPMAADMPYCINVESGSPFSPHTRSPQLMMDFATRGGFHLTAGALYPVQYLPTGPSGPSEDYVKYGLIPELYAGVSYEGKHFTARAGADFISLRPRWRTTSFYYGEDELHDIGTRVGDRISMISPFAFLQYENGMFKINAKSVFASGGDHLQLLSGYALYDWSDPLLYKYTPLRSSVSFLSFSVGRKIQFMCMGGYIKEFGTRHNMPVDENGYCDYTKIYYFSSGMRHMNQMFRVTPTLAYNLGRFTFALEYDNTCLQYGSVLRLDCFGRALENLHWITNHRGLGLVRYSF